MWMGEFADDEDGKMVATSHPLLNAENAWLARDEGPKIPVQLAETAKNGDSSKCRSPDGRAGYDCYACEKEWNEPQTCAAGYGPLDFGLGIQASCPYTCVAGMPASSNAIS